MNGSLDNGPPKQVARVLTIVLAEDDGELRRMLATVLRRDGHRVLEVSDGGDLHEDLVLLIRGRTERRDDLLVVTDLRLPVRDGLSVLLAMAACGRRLPFILITGFGDPATHAAAAALGALAVFDKPFDFDDLRAAVRAHAVAWPSADPSGDRPLPGSDEPLVP